MITISSHCIEIGNKKEHLLRIQAEQRKKLHHFCSLKTLDSIISNHALKLNNICNIGGNAQYEKDGIDTSLLGSIFVSCLTRSTHLWNEFGDNKRGAMITFSNCVEPLHKELIDSTRYALAYNTEQKLVAEYGINVSCISQPKLFCNWNKPTSVFVDLKMTNVDYTNDEPNSSIRIEGNMNLNLTNVARRVIAPYITEEETRLVGILRSANEIKEENIDYIMLPIDFNKVSTKVTFGKKVDKKKKHEISLKLDELGISWC